MYLTRKCSEDGTLSARLISTWVLLCRDGSLGGFLPSCLGFWWLLAFSKGVLGHAQITVQVIVVKVRFIHTLRIIQILCLPPSIIIIVFLRVLPPTFVRWKVHCVSGGAVTAWVVLALSCHLYLCFVHGTNFHTDVLVFLIQHNKVVVDRDHYRLFWFESRHWFTNVCILIFDRFLWFLDLCLPLNGCSLRLLTFLPHIFFKFHFQVEFLALLFDQLIIILVNHILINQTLLLHLLDLMS